MIVCSCNLLNDAQVRSAVATGVTRPRISYVYASLGCTAQCGRCVHTIKAFLANALARMDLEPFESTRAGSPVVEQKRD